MSYNTERHVKENRNGMNYIEVPGTDYKNEPDRISVVMLSKLNNEELCRLINDSDHPLIITLRKRIGG